MKGIKLKTAVQEDFSKLNNLRLAAMKDSLVKAGRYNPERSKERFRKSFKPHNTQIIYINKQIVGFFMVSVSKSCMFINHLYIKPELQGRGIGQKALHLLKDRAKQCKLNIELEALKNSLAAKFYGKNGFRIISETEFDYRYCFIV